MHAMQCSVQQRFKQYCQQETVGAAGHHDAMRCSRSTVVQCMLMLAIATDFTKGCVAL
jgi:hypothetical protein